MERSRVDVMRSEQEIIRAMSVLVGVETCAKHEKHRLPSFCGSEMEAFYLALAWARGEDNLFNQMLEGFFGIFRSHGTGIDDEGKPYDVKRTQ
jgi:hypothetical protein